MAASRRDKLEPAAAEAANAYLQAHPRAAAKTQLLRLRARRKTLGLDKFVEIAETQRRVVVTIDEAALAEAARLDGCYALRTDLQRPSSPKRSCTTATRTSPRSNGRSAIQETVQLEMRPVYLRDENRTRGHALVVMLAYLLTQELRRRWRDIDLTVPEGLDRLASLCTIERYTSSGPPTVGFRCRARRHSRSLEAAAIEIPAALPIAPGRVATKRKLPQRRKVK